MVFEFLAAQAGSVTSAQRDRPNSASHPSQHGVFRIHSVREEERQIGRKIIDRHPTRQIRLKIGEAVG